MGLAATLVACAARPAAAQRFLPDDPIQEDPDRLDMPAPRPNDVSDYYDTALNLALDPGDYDGPALNANTAQDVPRSSWYTPRHYYRRMTPEAIRRGPSAAGGPSENAPWEVMRLLDGGPALRLEIADGSGARYLLTLDPEVRPEQATGAEAVASRLFYALGYHVPESRIVRFERERLVPGTEEDVSRGDIHRLLRRAAYEGEGLYRALATRQPADADLLGPFLFYGTRPDDGNDVFAHEGRRELRGLRLFSAWLQHDGARAVHAQDWLVREGGRQFVRHYLVGLGTALGSNPDGMEDAWAGHEYFIDLEPALVRAVTLGFAGAPWARRPRPAYASIGRFDAAGFDPRAWKPRYPNPAFKRMDLHDAFWAAKQVAHFSDADLRAAVSAAAYSDSSAAAYLAGALMARRDSIARAYLGLGGGLDRFRVEEGRLVFADLLEQNGLADGDQLRRITWRLFDNAADSAGAVLVEAASSDEAFALPEAEPPFLKATLHTPGRGWTHVYLRRTPAGRYEVAGLEREEEHQPS